MTVDPKLLEHLAAFDTPTICNALELVAPERRGHGYSTKPFVAAFPSMAPIVGFARTGTISAIKPSTMNAVDAKALRLSYYEYVNRQPLPSIVVLQDIDPTPGYGAFWGEVHTAVHKALGAKGCITNGSIRDLDMIATEFQLLAGCLGPSHAFVHLEGYGDPVEVHGMKVAHDDLIHADRHGAVVIPLAVVDQLPAAIDLCSRREAPLLRVARSGDFTLDHLRAAFAEAEDIH
jgi:regulator of RNase E activity RraA